MKHNGVELDIIITPEGKGKSKVYSISSIQIPNVVTQGDTIEEAKRRLKEALSLYLEDMPQIRICLSKKEENAPLISRMLL
jgi:predicted RNase H-like HicB family nuclease